MDAVRVDLGGNRLAHHLGLAQDFLRGGRGKFADANQVHSNRAHGCDEVLADRDAELSKHPPQLALSTTGDNDVVG